MGHVNTSRTPKVWPKLLGFIYYAVFSIYLTTIGTTTFSEKLRPMLQMP